MEKKEDKRPIYEPPCARDLSAPSASGVPTPRGLCVTGGQLVYPGECQAGDSPGGTGGVCSPTGMGPNFGKCTLGNAAVEGCQSGGAP
jgi:hypothetical protein